MNNASNIRVVIAPDSFKGSITSFDAANAIKIGFEKENINDCICIPMADGGEGTVEAMIAATDGKLIRTIATGPMGHMVDSFYGILGDNETAVIEMAAASGLPLVAKDKRNPLVSSTYGTGELMLDAISRGCKKLIIGIGGSATNDGGTGMARALGVRFFDKVSKELPQGGSALKDLSRIDMSLFDKRLFDVDIRVACDVTNPLCGKTGASYIYAPQKGASPEMVKALDDALLNFASIVKHDIQKDILELPGSGAAGGLGGGLFAFANAKLQKGIDIITDITNIEDYIKDADLVITGEGQTDHQTAYGKVPSGIAKIAKKYSKPLICVSGSLGDGYEKLYDIGITACLSICDRPMDLSYAIENAEELLTNISRSIARIYLR